MFQVHNEPWLKLATTAGKTFGTRIFGGTSQHSFLGFSILTCKARVDLGRKNCTNPFAILHNGPVIATWKKHWWHILPCFSRQQSNHWLLHWYKLHSKTSWLNFCEAFSGHTPCQRTPLEEQMLSYSLMFVWLIVKASVYSSRWRYKLDGHQLYYPPFNGDLDACTRGAELNSVQKTLQAYISYYKSTLIYKVCESQDPRRATQTLCANFFTKTATSGVPRMLELLGQLHCIRLMRCRSQLDIWPQLWWMHHLAVWKAASSILSKKKSSKLVKDDQIWCLEGTVSLGNWVCRSFITDYRRTESSKTPI